MDNESLPTVQASASSHTETSAGDSKAQVPGSVLGMGFTPTTNQEVDDKSKSQVIKETLEVSGKILIGLAGLCYILGLIVVTIHLRGYGLNSLSLSQLQYVTAGVWVLLPSLVMMSFFGVAKFVVDAQDWKTKPGEPKWPKIFAVVYLLLALLLCFYVGAKYFMKAFDIKLTFYRWLVIPVLGAGAFAMMAAAIYRFLTKSADHRKDSEQNDRGAGGNSIKPANLGVVALGSFVLPMCMLYITLFAGNTYRDIPWATGGGRPSQVKLVIASDAKPYLASAGINFPVDPNRGDSDQNQTDSLQLLTVTEKEYVVINPNGRAVSIPIDSVKAVMYEK